MTIFGTMGYMLDLKVIKGAFLRKDTDKEKTSEFLEYLGKHIKSGGVLYLTGGASAVLIGWRERTIDIDCKFDPEPNGLFEALRQAKEALNINIELASPDHFIPVLPGWAERSRFIGKFGGLDVYHYDFYSQALAKIERGLQRDLEDVENMVKYGLIERRVVGEFFQKILNDLKKYPGIDQEAFSKKVERFLKRES